jgi:hypothetical protein
MEEDRHKKARQNYWTVVAILGVAILAFKIYADRKMAKMR